MKYIYSYETIRYDFTDWGPFAGNMYESLGHREIINRKAAEGWRFVAAVPSKQRGTGHTQEMDLIFEKELQ